jgi:flagellar motor switch protein FliM
MAKECRTYDFRKAARIEEPVARYLRTWMARACGSFQQRWSEICNTSVSVTPEPLFAQAFSNFQESCDPASFGVTVQLDPGQPDSVGLQSQLVVAQVDQLALVLELLSEELVGKPELRELTSIEMNLCELLLEQLSASLAESWLQKELLNCKSGQLDRNPQRARLYAGSDPIIVAGLNVHAKAGRVLFQWVLPRAATTALIKQLLGEPQRLEDRKPVNLQPLVEEMPVEVIVRLGETRLGMDDLLALRPGAIIVFDQPIDSPLTAYLDDQPLFLGWPGRQGIKQAFQVAEIP